MNNQEIKTLLKSTHSAQATIILAFLFFQTAMSIEELMIGTGLGDDAIRRAIKIMAGSDMLFKQTGNHGKTVWLPIRDTFFGSFMSQSPQKADSADIYDDDDESEKNKENKLLSSSINVQSPLKADSGTEEILEILKECGIKGRNLHTLAALPWMTPAYIRAHWQEVQSHDYDNPPGYLYTVLKYEETAPEITKQRYERQTIDKGKRGTENISYDFDIRQHIADHMGHERGCACIDCRMLLSANGDTRIICPTCKHYDCTCEEL